VLPDLIVTPQSDLDWSRWGFSHRDSHDRIRTAIRKKKNVQLSDYILDPINLNDFQTFLAANQQSHIEMCAALGVQSTDLGSVDPRNQSQLQAWIYTHYQEHYMAEQAAGV
jgi:L-cystine uptake protein TcyP (sodium:dicarboxylate symporter family)